VFLHVCSTLHRLTRDSFRRSSHAAAVPSHRRIGKSSPEARRLGRAIDSYVQPLIARGDLSGQLLVARRGVILVERNYGYANWELRVPVTADTRFDIMSVTKPMTGTIAIQLLSERAFGLRDSIARWFPDFPKGDRIKVEHLLQHSSGIPHELVPDSEATRPRSAAEMVEIAKHRPLDFEPGSKSTYSSGGFAVLTRILELVTGKSYAQLLDERIFVPLGMKHSTDHDSRHLLPQRASAVVPGPRGNENAPFQDFSGIIGAGSVWSTARDLHLFVQGLVVGRLGLGPKYSYLRQGKIDFNGQGGASEEELRRAVGTFQLEDGTKLVLRVHEGTLWSNDWVLLPQTKGGFFSPRDYGTVRPIASADGKIERLDWEQRGQLYPAPRVGD
jgi:CubicO group peptidase (beta-lactamase class C family)